MTLIRGWLNRALNNPAQDYSETCNKRTPCQLNKGVVRSIQVRFSVNMGKKIRDPSSRCSLNRGCRLDTGFTVFSVFNSCTFRWQKCRQACLRSENQSKKRRPGFNGKTFQSNDTVNFLFSFCFLCIFFIFILYLIFFYYFIIFFFFGGGG